MGWFEYLFQWDQRPRIPHHLVNADEIAQANEDELLIFMAGKARDRHYIERMMRRYKAKNALELLARIPRRRRPSIQKRIRALIMRAEGSLPYDPIRKEVRAIRAAAAPVETGIRKARMKPTYRG
jgi:hypothetical protein